MTSVYIPSEGGFITSDELNTALRKYSTVALTQTKLTRTGDFWSGSMSGASGASIIYATTGVFDGIIVSGTGGFGSTGPTGATGTFDSSSNITCASLTSLGDITATGGTGSFDRIIANTGSFTNTAVSNSIIFSGPVLLTTTTNRSVRIGINAGIGSANDVTCIGAAAGQSGQKAYALAVGREAGNSNQSTGAVAVGWNAGRNNQRDQAVAIGYNAGFTGQGTGSVAIGWNAGYTGQGQFAIAIGDEAGNTNQHANSIILNGDGVALNSVGSGFHVSPIRQSTGTNMLVYDTTTKEISYSNTGTFNNINFPGDIIIANPNVAHRTKIGYLAGQTGQGADCISIGSLSGSLNQGRFSIGIGREGGRQNQGTGSVGIGYASGSFNQGEGAISIGIRSGYNNQGTGAVALGKDAGFDGQLVNAVAIGNNSGYLRQRPNAVAIGFQAGYTGQGTGSVAIGWNAGYTGQGQFAIALGQEAGANNQGTQSVTVGWNSGNNNQGFNAVAIGANAGSYNQNGQSIAIGFGAGFSGQGSGSVAIGYQAGLTGQGQYSIAMGYQAGYVNQHANSIILNADSVPLNSVGSGFHVSPIRQSTGTTGSFPLQYDSITKEIFSIPPITFIESRSNTTQSISNNINTNVNFPIDDITINWNTSRANNSRFIPPYNGIYMISYIIRFASNNTGLRACWISLNDAKALTNNSWAMNYINPVNGEQTIFSGSDMVRATTSDFITLNVYQTSGGALNIGDATAGNVLIQNRIRIHYLGCC